MADVIRCADPARLRALHAQNAVNGIDHLVVVDAGGVPDPLRQRILLVRFAHPIADATLDSALGDAPVVTIRGGTRVVDPRVRWAVRLAALDTATIDPELSPADRAFLDAVRAEAVDVDEWLVVMTEEYGDHSNYVLQLRVGAAPPAGYDTRLSEIEFSFKVECPSAFDCVRNDVCPNEPADEPELDYLARDFNSFRRLMFDRLALIAPADTSREAATLRTTIVEALAYEADRLAYFQDSVSTETYLTTARTRPSVRRHSRLLGYEMHDGCNARGFVRFTLADGTVVGGHPIAAGSQLLTRVSFAGPVIAADRHADAAAEAPEYFEVVLAPETFSAAHNVIPIYTWGDGDCCLPAGTTQLWLADDGALAIAPGDFLLIEQTLDPETRIPADASPEARAVVRITAVDDPIADPLFPGTSARLVRWATADALPFALVVTAGELPVAAASANVVLVDHGRAVHAQDDTRLTIERWGNQRRLRATVPRPELTWSHRPTDEDADTLAATAWLRQDPRLATPQIVLTGEGERWTPSRDLLRSTASARAFVVETEHDGTARVRFGDNVHGRRPRPGSVGAAGDFVAAYRIGNGPSGNVGAGAIAHVVAGPSVAAALLDAVREIDNPLPTTGGLAPESPAEVRRDAPQAFRVQERAVTIADWVEVTERNPNVQRAIASLRWTGSWHTVFVTVDPVEGVDFESLRVELLDELDGVRLAGYDLALVAPTYVPLDIALTVCVEAFAFPDQVELALREEFSTGRLADGRLGFFHPDRFTFGDSVWLSQVIARCMSVTGVRYVDVRSDANPHRFKRRGHAQGTEIDDGRIRIGDLEIARCDSDPNAPEMGTIDFYLDGGS